MNELVLTPAAVVDLLLQIDELKDYEIGIAETEEGAIQLTIGDSVYDLNTEDATEVLVEEEVVDVVDEVNNDTYEDIEDDATIEVNNTEIESGIIKEGLKALAVGGLVTLTSKLLHK